MAVTIHECRSARTGVVSYRVRWRNEAGSSRGKTFKTRREALLAQARITSQIADDNFVDPSRGRVKFVDFHARWIAARTVSPSRSSAERSQAKVHILPRWGAIPLNKIRPLDVDRWVKDSPAGSATKNMMLAQFKLCLDAAVREGLIRVNPAASTKPPTVRRKRVTRDDVLDGEELQALVDAMPERWKALVYLSGWLGWRWSEAMGLQLRHIDWRSETVEVGARTVVECDGQLHVKDHGKTDASMRTIPLPGPALAVLQRHVDAGFSGAGVSGSLFVTEHGQTPFRSNFRRDFDRAVRDAGLSGRGINMRQLRHTAASLMLAAGMDLVDVQQRLGHSKGSTTLDIYARVLARRVDEGTGRLAQAMRGAAPTAA